MPDPAGKCLGSSEVPDIFNQGYKSRWLLWQKYANGLDIDPKEDLRMRAGTLMQPVILQLAAEELGLKVVPNEGDKFVKADGLRLGATIDAHCEDPIKGLGVVEAKSVDWLIWKDNWTDKMATMYVEIQLEVQMLCTGADWGVIAAWIGGNDLRLYYREPREKLRADIIEGVAAFWDDVEQLREPDVVGIKVETPAMAELWPASVEKKVIERLDDDELDEDIAMFEWARKQESMHKKIKEQKQPIVLRAAEDAGTLVTTHHRVYIKKSEGNPTLGDLPIGGLDAIQAVIDAKDDNSVLPHVLLDLALKMEEPRKVTRKASIRTTIKIKPIEDAVVVTPLNPLDSG